MPEPIPLASDEPSVPRGRIARAVVIQLVCRALGMMGSVVSVALTARYLGVSHYGQLTIAVVFIGMWASLADLGTAVVIVRRVTSGQGDLERLVRVNSGLSLVYCIPLAALAAGSGLLIYDDPDVQAMLAVMSLSLLLMTMTTRYEPVFLATVRFWAMALSDLASRLAKLGIVAWLVASHAGIIWFAVAQLIPPVVTLLFQGVAASRLISVRPVFSMRESAGLLLETLPQMGIIVVTVLYWKADGVILSLLSSHAEVGVYGLAQTIAVNVLVISAFFMAATLSTATALFSRDVAAFAAFIRRNVEIMYFLGVPIAVIGAMLAGPLIELFGSKEFVERGAPTLALLCIAITLRFVAGTVCQGLFAARHQRFLLRLTTGTLAFNIALNFALAGRFGAVGAGVALICTELYAIVLASWWLHRKCDYRPPVLFLVRVLVPTAMAAAVVLLLSGHHVVIVAGAAVVVYMLTNFAIGPVTWSMLTTTLRGRQLVNNVS